MATRTYLKCKKRQNTTDIKPNKHQKVLETIIKNATQMWCSDPIHLRNPLQFLQLSSHCINDVYMEASQAHLIASAEHRTNSGNHDDDRHFNLSKSNSSRRNKTCTTKDAKKNYVAIADEEMMVTLVEDISTKSSPVPQPITVKTVNRSEPPPLAFFPKKGNIQKPIIFSATEPPPLVPIARNFA